MTAAVLALVLLVTYRVVLLIVADKITERPREWVQRRLTGIGVHDPVDRWWGYVGEDPLVVRARREAGPPPIDMSRLTGESTERRGYVWWAECSCGLIVSAPDRAADADAQLDEHRRKATTPDNRLAYLLTCPWCVSPYVGAAVAWSGWCWGDRAWWFIPAAALAASAATGFLAHFAAPGDEP